VKKIEISKKRRAEINFPITTSSSETGKVSKPSIEPVFLSSAISRIVIAGVKKTRIIGDKSKKYDRESCPARKKLEKRNQPLIKRNVTITM